MKSIIKKVTSILILFTLVCGVIYPLTVTCIAQVIFPNQANGSIVEIDGKKYGSSLLAQQFTKDQYLWGRMMNLDVSTFTDDQGNPLMYATPSNIAVSSRDMQERVKQRVKELQEAHPTMKDVDIPVDLVSMSGSGLDPEISLAAAHYQIDRIVSHGEYTKQEVEAIIDQHTTHRFLGIFGEPTVNVLKVNLTLAGLL